MGLKEASKITTVSLSTLRRRRADLIAAGARATDSGWEIPISALVQLGLLPRTTPAEDFDAEQPPPAAGGVPGVEGSAAIAAAVEELRAQLEESERRAADAEKRAAVAEAVAAERDRIITRQDQMLRMLEARPAPQAVHAAPPPGPTGPPPAYPPPKPRDWFRG